MLYKANNEGMIYAQMDIMDPETITGPKDQFP